jgi:glucose/mannose-6-phosphate isomerase
VTVEVDDAVLDDVAALEAGDPDQMLRAVASGAAQIRGALTASADAGLEQLEAMGRPRAVVVAGMGGSGIPGDVLAAMAASGAQAPVVVQRGPGLPGWVGAADVVIAVSCSGATQETLAATDEAVRRGAVLVGVGAADSPLSRRCTQARAPFVPVVKQLSPRSSMWALATPVLVTGGRLGRLDLTPEALEAAAVRLEAVAETCRPDREAFVNPAKQLALELTGMLPMIWGAGTTGGVAAYRFGCQLAENAKRPAVVGQLPEAHHNQVVAFGGRLAGGAGSDDDLFRDRVEDEQPLRLRLRLVLLHDDDADETVAARVAVSEQIAHEHGVPVTSLRSEGEGPLERFASLVGLVDYATVYLALLEGIDPTPVAPIDALKLRLD